MIYTMTHRFYSGDTKDRSGELSLMHDLWINDQVLANQVLRVLRMRLGEQLVLFDGKGREVLYKIAEIEPRAFRLEMVTELVPKHPARKLTLAWSLLKKDKNDWVIQKCTELGVSHFVPIISERTEKTGFDEGRAHKIIVEAVEQCGRHDIPTVQEPIDLRNFIGQHVESTSIFVADMDGDVVGKTDLDHAVILVGPEGGWSDAERAFFAEKSLPTIGLGHFTLRAETASIAAAQQLL